MHAMGKLPELGQAGIEVAFGRIKTARSIRLDGRDKQCLSNDRPCTINAGIQWPLVSVHSMTDIHCSPLVTPNGDQLHRSALRAAFCLILGLVDSVGLKDFLRVAESTGAGHFSRRDDLTHHRVVVPHDGRSGPSLHGLGIPEREQEVVIAGERDAVPTFPAVAQTKLLTHGQRRQEQNAEQRGAEEVFVCLHDLVVGFVFDE